MKIEKEVEYIIPVETTNHGAIDIMLKEAQALELRDALMEALVDTNK